MQPPRPDVFGWFDRDDATKPAHDPGMAGKCPVCGLVLSWDLSPIELETLRHFCEPRRSRFSVPNSDDHQAAVSRLRFIGFLESGFDDDERVWRTTDAGRAALSQPDPPVRTVSLMPVGGDRSYFFRTHRQCWDELSQAGRQAIESSVIDG